MYICVLRNDLDRPKRMNPAQRSLQTWCLICLLLLSLPLSLRVCATSFMPPVTNYLVKEYHAGYQNWACTQGPSGEMYFGNSEGLLVYDGYRWSLHKVPGTNIVRSVYAKGGRIYVGSFEEFGYFEYDARGSLQYHSLCELLGHFQMENDEIWNIVEMRSPYCCFLDS